MIEIEKGDGVDIVVVVIGTGAVVDVFVMKTEKAQMGF